MIDWTIPIILVTPNTQEHWTAKHRRNKRIFSLISRKWIFEKAKVTLPCIITLTRYGPRLWDEDNNIYSCKSLRDTLTQLIFPDKTRGHGDNNPQIQWIYKQEKSKQKGIRIQIQQNTNSKA